MERSDRIAAIDTVFAYFDRVRQEYVELQKRHMLLFIPIFELEFENRKASEQKTEEGRCPGLIYLAETSYFSRGIYHIPSHGGTRGALINVWGPDNTLIILHSDGRYKIASDKMEKAKKTVKSMYNLYSQDSSDDEPDSN